MAQVWLVTGSSRGLGRAIVEAGLVRQCTHIFPSTDRLTVVCCLCTVYRVDA
jgi:NAD(P)-dependent dehydrogenase (short-subunit alcohol dehydrogenase family)